MCDRFDAKSGDALTSRGLIAMLPTSASPDTDRRRWRQRAPAYGVKLLAIYEAAGASPAGGKRPMDRLLAQGMIRLGCTGWPGRGRGHQPVVVEPLAPGLAELAGRGISPPARRLTTGSRGRPPCQPAARWTPAYGRASLRPILPGELPLPDSATLPTHVIRRDTGARRVRRKV